MAKIVDDTRARRCSTPFPLNTTRLRTRPSFTLASIPGHPFHRINDCSKIERPPSLPPFVSLAPSIQDQFSILHSPRRSLATLPVARQSRKFRAVDNQVFSSGSSLLLAFAVLLDLRDFQSTVRSAGVHDLGPPAVLYRGHQSLHRLDVHVLGADFQGRAWVPVPHAFPDAGCLRLPQLDRKSVV